MDANFRFSVTHLLRFSGPLTVLHGKVESGSISVGDRIELRSPQGFLEVYVSGIEQARTFHRRAKAGEEVTLAVNIRDLSPVGDGCRRSASGGTEVVSLHLVPPRRSWWRFWQPRRSDPSTADPQR